MALRFHQSARLAHGTFARMQRGVHIRHISFLPQQPVKATSRITRVTKRCYTAPIPQEPHHYSANDLYLRVQDLDRALRVRGYSVLRITFGTVLLLGFYTYLFKEEIKDTVADVTADITSRSLGDEEVKAKAENLSKSVVHEVLTDPTTAEKATMFIKDVSTREDIKAAIVALLTLVLEDPASVNKVQELLSTVVIRLLNDEHIRNQGLDYLMWLLVQPGTKAALVTLLKDTFADPYFQDISYTFFGGVVRSDSVQAAANELGVNTSNWVLANEQVREQAQRLVYDVLRDETIHQSGGEAIWQAVKYSLPGSRLFRGRSASTSSDTGPDVPIPPTPLGKQYSSKATPAPPPEPKRAPEAKSQSKSTPDTEPDNFEDNTKPSGAPIPATAPAPAPGPQNDATLTLSEAPKGDDDALRSTETISSRPRGRQSEPLVRQGSGEPISRRPSDIIDSLTQSQLELIRAERRYTPAPRSPPSPEAVESLPNEPGADVIQAALPTDGNGAPDAETIQALLLANGKGGEVHGDQERHRSALDAREPIGMAGMPIVAPPLADAPLTPKSLPPAKRN